VSIVGIITILHRTLW